MSQLKGAALGTSFCPTNREFCTGISRSAWLRREEEGSSKTVFVRMESLLILFCETSVQTSDLLYIQDLFCNIVYSIYILYTCKGWISGTRDSALTQSWESRIPSPLPRGLVVGQLQNLGVPEDVQPQLCEAHAELGAVEQIEVPVTIQNLHHPGQNRSDHGLQAAPQCVSATGEDQEIQN